MEQETSSPISHAIYVTGLVLIAVLAVVVRLHLLTQPLDRDEGLYAYMAQRLLVGGVPYRDTFSDKPPVAFLIYSGFMLVFGQSVVGIHLGGAIWAAVASLLLAELGRRLHGRTVGLVAGLLFAVSSAEGSVQGSSINLELLLAPMAVAALLLLVGKSSSIGRCLMSGMLLGSTLLTKQQAIGHAAFASMWVLLEWWGSSRRKIWDLIARQAMLLGGAVAVLVVSLLTFAALDSLGLYLDGLVGYNLQTYVGREPLSRAWSNFWSSFRTIFAGNPLLYVAGMVGMAALLRTRTREGLFVPLWWIANLATVSVGLRFYKHYFLLPQPALVLGAAYTIGRAIEWIWQSEKARRLRWAVVLGSALVISSPLITQNGYFFRWSAWQHVHALYGPELFTESQRIADFLRDSTSPDDSVFVLGSEPQIYFLARRRCAIRYAFEHPLVSRGEGPLKRQIAAYSSLERERPAFILLVSVIMSHLTDSEAIPYFTERLKPFAIANYDGVLAVYLREDHAEYRSAAPGERIEGVPGDPSSAFLLERRDRRPKASSPNAPS